MQFSASLIRIRLPFVFLALCLLQSCGWGPLGSKEQYLRRADGFVQKGKYEDAELQYRKALQKDNNYGEACLHYGQLLVRLDKTPEAFELLLRAASLMPASREAAEALGRLSVSQLLRTPGRPRILYETAAKMSDRLLAANPNSSEAWRLRGYLAVSDARPKDAINLFRRSLQARSDQADVATVLVQTLLIDGQDAEAEGYALGALKSLKHSGPLYDVLYGSYMASHRTPEAEQLLKSKIENNRGEAFFVVQLADHYRSQNQIPQMDEQLRKLVAEQRNYTSARLIAGDYYRRIGRADEAVSLYLQGAQNESANRKGYLRRIVETRLEQGRVREARETLDVFLKENPDDVEALASRAELRMATATPEEIQAAVGELDALVTKYPENNSLRYNLARALRRTGRDAEAKVALNEILRRDAQNRNALRELSDMAIRHQQTGEALQYADRLLTIDPGNTGGRLVRTAAWALDGRFNDVRLELRRITDENPNQIEAWLQTATLQIETRNYAEAEKILRRFYTPGGEDIRFARALINLFFAEGQPQKALALAKEQAAHTKSPEVRILLATTAAQAGDVDLALAVAQELASDFPRNPDHMVVVGRMLGQKGQLEPAIAAFRKACESAPADPVPEIYLADALGQAGRLDEAVAVARKARDLRPRDAALMNTLAWHLALARKQLDEAATLVEGSLASEPDNAAFLDTAGMVYLRARKLDDSVRMFQRAVEKDPAQATYHQHFAEVLIEIGNRGQARKEIESALRSHPSAMESKALQDLLKRAS